MELLISEDFVFLSILSIFLTNLFLLAANVYLFKKFTHLQLAVGYTFKTLKKLYPEFGTEADLEAILQDIRTRRSED